MSDIYLVLRHRLDDVATDWVELGTEVMRSARRGQGLSYESAGRKISVSAKSYERYEKAGRVPRHLLDRVANVLDLEVERSARQKVVIEDGGAGQTLEERLETVEHELDEIRGVKGAVDRIEALLLERRDPPLAESEQA